MEVEKTLSGYKINLPTPQGKVEYYAFRRIGSDTWRYIRYSEAEVVSLIIMRG